SMGLAESTIFVFAIDNGPYWRQSFVDMFHHNAAGEFRGMEGDAFEGGHRLSFIVRYPGKVKAGTVSDVTTTHANLMATCADIIGQRAKKFETEDSYSIWPILTGKSEAIAEQPAIVNISSRGTYSIRKGNWKLITRLGSGGFTVPFAEEAVPGGPAGQLYDLATDIHEDT